MDEERQQREAKVVSLRASVRDEALEGPHGGLRGSCNSGFTIHATSWRARANAGLDSTRLAPWFGCNLALRFAGDLRLPHVLAPLVCEIGAIHRLGSSGLDLAGDLGAGTSIA